VQGAILGPELGFIPARAGLAAEDGHVMATTPFLLHFSGDDDLIKREFPELSGGVTKHLEGISIGEHRSIFGGHDDRFPGRFYQQSILLFRSSKGGLCPFPPLFGAEASGHQIDKQEGNDDHDSQRDDDQVMGDGLDLVLHIVDVDSGSEDPTPLLESLHI